MSASHFRVLVSLENAVDILYMGFSKVSDKMPQNIFVNIFTKYYLVKKYGLGDSSILCIYNWFNNYSKRILTSKLKLHISGDKTSNLLSLDDSKLFYINNLDAYVRYKVTINKSNNVI